MWTEVWVIFENLSHKQQFQDLVYGMLTKRVVFNGNWHQMMLLVTSYNNDKRKRKDKDLHFTE